MSKQSANANITKKLASTGNSRIFLVNIDYVKSFRDNTRWTSDA